MGSLFYARRYPAGREVTPGDLSGPNDTLVSLADELLPTANDLMSSDVPPQSTGVPDSLPTPSDLPPVTTTTTVQNPPPPESTTVPGQNPTNQLIICRDQYPPSSTPAPNPTPSPSPEKRGLASSSPPPTQSDYFVPSSALNHPRPTTTQTLGTDTTPVPPSTIISTRNLPASSTVNLSTDTLQPTPTAVFTGGGAVSKGSSSNRKYIIGGAVGGGVLVLILLALLLFCCRKRRAKRDLERSGGGHSEGQPGYGQFACCNHGTCDRNNGQPKMEQKTPLKPFILKSDPAAPTPKQGQQHNVPLGRRDSTESQKSAGSDASTGSSYSSDSEGSQRGKRRSQKRPPPLKLTALVTPVINGPQNNPRGRVDRSSLPNPHGVPAFIVEPPQSETPDRMRRH